MFGLEAIESLLNPAGMAGLAAAVDLESWHTNPRSYLDAVDFILSQAPNPAIFLSGDVHYAFQVAIALRGARGARVPVAQFTSSATKNMPTGSLGLAAGGLGILQSKLAETRGWRWSSEEDGPVHSFTGPEAILRLLRLNVIERSQFIPFISFASVGQTVFLRNKLARWSSRVAW